MNTCGVFIVNLKNPVDYNAGSLQDLSRIIPSLMDAGVIQISLQGFEPSILSSLSINNETYLHAVTSDERGSATSLWLHESMDHEGMAHVIIIENLKITQDQIVSLLDVHYSCRKGLTLGLSSDLSKGLSYNLDNKARISIAEAKTAHLKTWYSGGVAIVDMQAMHVKGFDPGLTNWSEIIEKAVPEGKVCGCPLGNVHKAYLHSLDNTWTLFLDRDGVINTRIPGSYVMHPDEFEFLDGVPEALALLRPLFGRMVIVTNQQGIDKQVMTQAELSVVHQSMLDVLLAHGVCLDAIYFCPGLEKDRPLCRKPLPGMALQAVEDFPKIDFSRSIMVGDSPSDIEFGNRLGMITVKVGRTCMIEDHVIDSLADLPSLLTDSV